MKISAYKPYTNKAGITNPGCFPFDADFETEMQRIKDGYYKYIISQCRAITDHKQRNDFKAKNLPSLTISAVCKEWRKDGNVINHTGLITFDIDKDHNPSVTDWGKLRDDIFKSDKVVCAFLSASGNGLAFIVKCIPSQHKDVFYSIEKEFKEQLNIIIDISGKDVVRLRFISYDPELKIKENIETVPVTLPSENYLKIKNDTPVKIQYSSRSDSWQTFNHAVTFAQSKLDFTDGTKHWHLVNVASYCNLVGMSREFCIAMAKKHYDTTADIATPINNVYKTYRQQHATKTLPKPPYKLKELKWMLNKISKPLLKKYIHQFGKDTYIGRLDHSIQVSSKLLAFTMWIIAPDYTWTVNSAKEIFTNAECKDTIPEDCYVDSCNGNRVWCKKNNNYPINWN
jgi:hypothetical protein